MHDGQREAGSHRRIHRIAALFQDFNARIGSQMVNADHHRMPGADRLLVGSSHGIVPGVIGSGVLRTKDVGRK
jgi:hypothetical protein